MDGPYSRAEAKRLVRDFLCGECGGPLVDPWGGSYGINGQVVRCLADSDHQGLSPRGRETKRLYDGERMVTIDVESQQIVRAPGNTALALPENEPGMVDRMHEAMSVGLFPGKNVSADQIRNLAKLAILYRLDPLMGEIMPYQGQPYITIAGRRRIDDRAGNHPSIKISPMDTDTYNAYLRMGAIDDGDIVVVGVFADPRTGQTVEATGRVLASETGGNPNLPVVKWRLEMAWKRCEARGRKMLYGPVAMPGGLDALLRLAEEDEVEDMAIVGVSRPGVVESTGEIQDETPALPETPPARATAPPSASGLGRCEAHDQAWGKMPSGRIGHPVQGADACWRDEREPASGVEEQPDADSDAVALRDLQTRIGAFGWEWGNFQDEVLKMPWEEWVRLGQGVEVAWTRFEAFRSQQEE